LVLLIVYYLGVAGVYDLGLASRILPALVEGAETTLGLVAIVIPVGFALGFVFGFGRTSHSWFVRSVCTTYVEFFRGMPPVVLVWFAFIIIVLLITNVEFLNVRIQDPFAVATLMSVLALAGHSGSYQAEIVRAGILSVPAGQREAAEAIGMTRGSTMIHIILPQMFRVSLPALGNEFASVIKDTSILSVVGVMDLTFRGQNIVSRLFTSPTGGSLSSIFVVWLEIAVLYFVVTFSVSRLLQWLEQRYRVPGLEAAQL
jgi:polar amino acid transport system permease protein